MGRLMTVIVFCAVLLPVPLTPRSAAPDAPRGQAELAASAAGQEKRFPTPEIPDYEFPETTTPAPRPWGMELIDLSLLAGALVIGAVLVLRYRRRWAIVLLLLACLGYFGFYRGGCVCPIGAIQNVALALADGARATAAFLADPSWARWNAIGTALAQPGYAIPWVVAGFFLLPLVAALLVGRVFCSAVCPLGAVQDVVAWKPLRVPPALAVPLGLLPFAFLAGGALLAGTGTAFLICRYDPFVHFFRLSGPMTILLLGGLLLVVGVFIARPYCRFLCPLGAIFRMFSWLSWTHATITPDECIRCRLCEDVCPYDAIRPPSRYDQSPSQGKALLAVALISVPLLAAAGGWAGHRWGPLLGQLDYRVTLAHALARHEADPSADVPDEVEAFRETGREVEQAYAAAETLQTELATGGAVAGGFLGLVVGGTLVRLSVRRTRRDFEIDRAQCFSCGRCFAVCPIEQKRRRGGRPAEQGKALPPDKDRQEPAE